MTRRWARVFAVGSLATLWASCLPAPRVAQPTVARERCVQTESPAPRASVAADAGIAAPTVIAAPQPPPSWGPIAVSAFWFVAPRTLVEHPISVIDGEAHFFEVDGVLLRTEPFFATDRTRRNSEPIELGDRRGTLETHQQDGEGEFVVRWLPLPAQRDRRGRVVLSLQDPSLLALRWRTTEQRETALRIARSLRLTAPPPDAEAPRESDALLGALELGEYNSASERGFANRALAERAARHLQRALRDHRDHPSRIEWCLYAVQALQAIGEHRAVIALATAARDEPRAQTDPAQRLYRGILLAECNARLRVGDREPGLARCREALSAMSASERPEHAESILLYAEQLLAAGRVAEARAQLDSIDVGSLRPASVERHRAAMQRLAERAARPGDAGVR